SARGVVPPCPAMTANPQVAHCRIGLKSMMPLNHRESRRLAASADKCERPGGKQGEKPVLNGLRATPERSIPCRGGRKIGRQRGFYGQFPETVQKAGFDKNLTGGNTLMRKWYIAAAAAAIFV